MPHQPSLLAVWMCPVCSSDVTLLPAPKPGEYEIIIETRGVYITESDALACIERHAASTQASVPAGGA